MQKFLKKSSVAEGKQTLLIGDIYQTSAIIELTNV
jgi:hypothetical protein